MFLMPVPGAATDTTRQPFIGRVHRLRTVGLGLGAFAVATVLYQTRSHGIFWALLLFHGFLWPHLAWLRTVRADDPTRIERDNLLIDSAMVALWAAAMHFAPLPSVALGVMVTADNIHIGGWRRLARTLCVQVAVCVAVASTLWLIDHGYPFDVQTSLLVLAGSLPLLIVYPLMVSTAMHELASRVRAQNRDLERIASIDSATGLLNRANWEIAVSRELRRLHRHAVSASLLMIDIDHFKAINDRYGHQVGDAVIAMVAATIREIVREVDVGSRYGGDEFGVLLSHTGEHAATVAAERIRLRVGAALVANAPGLTCTLSIGIAAATKDMVQTRAWIERADAALYRAKTLGRNRVARATE